MSVKIRLTRMGRKKRPFYRIIAVDNRRRRDGAYIESLGYYHPLDDPPTVKIDADQTLKWLRVGAQPSETVLSILRREGVWLRFRLEKRGLPENQIDEKMAEWFAAHAKAKEQLEAAKAKPVKQPEAELEAKAIDDTENEKPETEPEIEAVADTKKEKPETEPELEAVAETEKEKPEVEPEVEAVSEAEEEKPEAKPELEAVAEAEEEKPEAKPELEAVAEVEAKKPETEPEVEAVAEVEAKKPETEPEVEVVAEAEKETTETEEKDKTE